MDARQVSNYLSSLREKTGLTYEAIAEKSGRSESTVKNLCRGKTEDPRLDTVAPVVFAMGGSLDELFTGKSKDKVKEISISSIKEIYEQQLSEMAKINESHINNIRLHYEQHREDVTLSYERLLGEKDNQIKHSKKLAMLGLIFGCAGLAILISILILEVANPSLGWIRF